MELMVLEVATKEAIVRRERRLAVVNARNVDGNEVTFMMNNPRTVLTAPRFLIQYHRSSYSSFSPV